MYLAPLLYLFLKRQVFIDIILMRILSRVSDALNAHYFVGVGNEIALLSLPNLSLYFSLSSSFGRKIVPPKWSAAVYRTTVTAYLGSRIFRRRGRTPVEVLVRSLRYFTARVHAIIVFLDRIDQSTASHVLPSYSRSFKRKENSK